MNKVNICNNILSSVYACVYEGRKVYLLNVCLLRAMINNITNVKILTKLIIIMNVVVVVVRA